MVKAADTNVIMISIHPQFAEAIFRGEKTIEFRKLNIPKKVEHVVLYVTAPESKIAGYFSVRGVVEDKATELWKQYQDVSGTTKDFFFRYYGEDGIGRGILVDKVDILEIPLTLDNLMSGAKPPQSFTYIDKLTWLSLKRRKKKLVKKSEKFPLVENDLSPVKLYQAEDGQSTLEVQLKDETVWLNQQQMASLFQIERSVITKHISNIFKTGELDKKSVCAKLAHTAADNKTYQTNFYNLDIIIAVGYRVNARRGTQFRIWATTILKDHLIKGYTLNQRRLAEKGIHEAQQVLSLLANTLGNHNLVTEEGRSVLNLVNQYSKTWQLLLQYDEDKLPLPNSRQVIGEVLDIDGARSAINSLKRELMAKLEATDLFGYERSGGLAGIIGAIHQTFGGHDLYPSIEEKAANLLYFVIKDHPFTDGNKRIGSFLFLLFLQINGLLDKKHFDNKALVALTLLTAASDPGQKDLLIRLIVNLLTGE